jgi:Ca-activated chloride channel homolog
MINFENPWLLLLIPLPWLIRRLLPPVIHKYKEGLKVPFYNDLCATLTTHQHKTSHHKLFLAFCIWSLLLLSAANPQWLGKSYDLPRSGRDILLAIDISGSMEIPDMELNNQTTDRLNVVKQVAQRFVQQRAGDRVGLILFGSRAYLQTPLTFDLKTIQAMLNDATVGLAGPQTAIGDAIGLAIKHLRKYNQDSKVLILLTDGVNNSGWVAPLDAAKVAADYGIRIYTIGLGSNQMLLPSRFGTQLLNPSFELDETTLQEIAGITKGVYFRAENPQDLANVYRHLNQLEPRMGNKEIFRPKTPLYPWPLGLALLLSWLWALFHVFPYRLSRWI